MADRYADVLGAAPQRRRQVPEVPADTDLVVETAATGPAAEALTRHLRERVAAALGPLPLTVHLVAPRSIPRTTSGKVRRLDVRARLRAATPPSPVRGDA